MKFQRLVEDIRDLIDGLTAKVPVPSELQELKVQDDIAAMIDDTQSLHMFKEACKDDYPQWWAAASAAIDTSDVVTLDNRLADERLELYGTSNHSDTDDPLSKYFGDQQGWCHRAVHKKSNQEGQCISTPGCKSFSC